MSSTHPGLLVGTPLGDGLVQPRLPEDHFFHLSNVVERCDDDVASIPDGWINHVARDDPSLDGHVTGSTSMCPLYRTERHFGVFAGPAP
jgi:hypothetical protein